MGSIEDHAIYPDLLRQFRNAGHAVYTVSTREKRLGLPTEYREDHGAHALRVQIGNITKCGLIEKGISTVAIEGQYKRAIQQYISDVKFDLVLYSTPPITLAGVVKYIKKRDNASTYLLLKDIFPQNAVDLGMMSRRGIKAPLYWYFRRKEKQLYAISDRIGCMSQANVDYVIRHNPEIDPNKVEVCPNSIDVVDMRISQTEREAIRGKYGIPLDKKVFVYGGNLGKPQGIPFLIDCLRTQEQNSDAYFLIVGNGTEFGKLQAYFDAVQPKNMKLLKSIPKEDYDRMAAACDVGMIFLDHRFTIPNFPSRLLSYLQAGLPVLACTDPNTDIGKVIVDGGFGWWCESNDAVAFARLSEEAAHASLPDMGQRGWRYLLSHYEAENAYRIIARFVGSK